VKRVYNIHVGEIAIKGKNRKFFESRLMENIRSATNCRVESAMGRFILHPGKTGRSKIEEGLSKTFGIEWFSESFYIKNRIEVITDTVMKNADRKKTLKLDTRRAYKGYPMTSPEINKKVGMALEKAGFRIDLENPEERVFIEILKDSALVSLRKIRGLGGLPVGCSGKVLSLLSGGIDSPVASWLMMKRGCTVDFLHLHAFPTNKKAKKSKIMRMVKKLKEYSPAKIRLFLVPYGRFYEKSFEIKPKNELVVFRRFIFRIANKITEKEGYLGFVTGDSIGQVASQTLENLYATTDASFHPVYRPLLGYDKREIIDLAKKIGTYDISIEKYRDCCSLVAEKHPATKAKPGAVKREEKKINVEKIAEDTMKETEIVEF
jgi:thiamine biosynthesis protein ThiI